MRLQRHGACVERAHLHGRDARCLHSITLRRMHLPSCLLLRFQICLTNKLRNDLSLGSLQPGFTPKSPELLRAYDTEMTRAIHEKNPIAPPRAPLLDLGPGGASPPAFRMRYGNSDATCDCFVCCMTLKRQCLFGGPLIYWATGQGAANVAPPHSAQPPAGGKRGWQSCTECGAAPRSRRNEPMLHRDGCGEGVRAAKKRRGRGGSAI